MTLRPMMSMIRSRFSLWANGPSGYRPEGNQCSRTWGTEENSNKTYHEIIDKINSVWINTLPRQNSTGGEVWDIVNPRIQRRKETVDRFTGAMVALSIEHLRALAQLVLYKTQCAFHRRFSRRHALQCPAFRPNPRFPGAPEGRELNGPVAACARQAQASAVPRPCLGELNTARLLSPFLDPGAGRAFR